MKYSDRYSVVHADLNGDGIADEARLLVSTGDERFGLFVFLSQKNAAFKAHPIYLDKNAEFLPAIGIEKVGSGVYVTACGKGY